MLQSDPVRRLFNQPNIVIKTVPLTVNGDTTSKKGIFGSHKNGMNTNLDMCKPPEICIVPVTLSDEDREDANLLPSKTEDKKSEIVLLPIKRKLCGHDEPCENIVCDVMIQQYVDQDKILPILAVNIEEDEINAPVAKHCKNEYCDALSIDHNRCRRALIKLYRCDISHMCDICGITLRGLKSRVYHRNCKRKTEYRHNNVGRVRLLKERMRERELQMIEAAKTKKNDYLDPVKGYDLTMETLRKNEELIIIPKTVPNQRPIITITSIPNTQSIGINPSSANQSFSVNPQVNNVENVKSVPFAIAAQSAAIRPSSASRLEESRAQTMNQLRFSNARQDAYCVTSNSIPVPPLIATQSQYVRLATPSQTTGQPITINNWVVSPSSHGIVTTIPIQPKPILTPIRVVPITNLITAPSLLHRTQGIPKFCIMTDNMITPLTIPDPPPLQPVTITTNAVTNAATIAVTTAATNVVINAATNAVINVAGNTVNTATKIATDATAIAVARQERAPKVPIQVSIQKRCKSLKKFNKRPKKFFCIYCSKHFSTDWYFKMHVAKHKGEKLFFCNLCDESFSNRYDMKKHTTKKHGGREKFACDQGRKSSASFKSRITPSSDKTNGRLERHRRIKAECNSESYEEFSVDETTLIPDLNGVDTKSLKHEDKLDDWNENTKILINGTKTEVHDDVESHEITHIIKERDDRELLKVNRNNNGKINEFIFVSVTENVASEDIDKLL